MTHCLGRANPRQATGGAHMRCKQIAISIARRVVHAVLPQSRETAWGITWKVTEFLGFFTSGKLRLLSRTGLVTAARGRHLPDIGETSTFSPSRNSRNLLIAFLVWRSWRFIVGNFSAPIMDAFARRHIDLGRRKTSG